MKNNNSKILTLKKSDFIKLGGSYIMEQLDVKSALANYYINNLPFIVDCSTLKKEFNITERTIELLKDKNNSATFIKIAGLLSHVLDIRESINNIQNGLVADDVELFNIKCTALIVEELSTLIKDFKLITFPNLAPVIDILDPEKTHVPSFYIYNAYSSELRALRKKLSKAENDSDLFQETIEIEDKIRKELSAKLKAHSTNLQLALDRVAYFDILVAKASLAIKLNLCKPVISYIKTSYTNLFNPEIKELLKQRNKTYQPIDIKFEKSPNLITGINMGGKSVVLTTLALSQYLCQFGFYVPASKAQIALVDNIMLCMEDKQNYLEGLSSFAAEMKNVNNIINETKKNDNIFIFIDELARTTNPTEGKAIVNAMLETLKEKNIRSFITTHYDDIFIKCRRLRVKGLKENTVISANTSIEKSIDYSLIEDNGTSSPREAIKIAEMLGVDKGFIEKTKYLLKYNNTNNIQYERTKK